MKLDRLLSIVILLLNRRKMQAKDLADLFEVSVRTIYRDIETINQAGIPIVTFQGTGGGIGIMEHYKWDAQVFSDDDISSMLMALSGLGYSLKGMQMDRVMEKIKGMLPEQKLQEIEQKYNRVVIDLSGWDWQHRNEQEFKLLKEAIEKHIVVTFSYFSANGAETVRSLEPIRIYYKGQSWYVYGFCRLREDFRFFKLSRIRGLAFSDQIFEPHSEAVMKISWEEDQEKNRCANPASLRLKFNYSVRFRVEEYFEHSTLRYEPDGIYTEVSYPEDDWLYSFLLSFGHCVEVMHPLHIRENLLERAKAIVHLYEYS